MKAYMIVVVLAFALIMWAITSIIKKVKGKDLNEDLVETKSKERDESTDKSFLEKYCNDQKNDSRRALANYILIHENNERKDRGQE